MWTILATSSPGSPMGLAGEGLDQWCLGQAVPLWNPQPLGSGVLEMASSHHPHPPAYARIHATVHVCAC